MLFRSCLTACSTTGTCSSAARAVGAPRPLPPQDEAVSCEQHWKEKEGVQAETLREENAAMKRPEPPCEARWKCRGRGKRGKPNCGFPRFPPPLGNRHRRDFHIPTAPTTLPCSQNPKTRTPRPAPFGRPPQHDERRIHRPQKTNLAFDSSSSPRPENQRPISGSCLDWKMLARKKLAGTVSGGV